VSLLLRAHLRYLGRERAQVALAVLGIAVGVAVVVAVDLVNASSREAMRIASERLGGTATHWVTGPGDRIPEGRYAELRRAWRAGEGHLAEAERIVPVVEGTVILPPEPAAAPGPPPTLTILGVDPLADAAVRALTPELGDGDGAGRLLAEPWSVLLDAQTARRLGVEPGERLEVTAAGRSRALLVLDTVPAGDAVLGSGFAVADLATAQELLGLVGWLSRIDVVLPEGGRGPEGLRLLERLFPGLVVRSAQTRARDLGAGLRLVDRAERETDLRALSASFQLNLAALGLLALAVGLFLIHGTLTYSVRRRLRDFGRLRALGVTPAELRGGILAEAAVLALAGTALGLVGGRVLAGGLLELVSATLEGLYERVAVGALAPDPVPWLKGAAVGVVGSLAVAWPAARAAAAAPPGLLQRAEAGEGSPRRRAAAVAGLLALAGVALLPGTGYGGALLAIGAVLLAAALLTGPAVAGLLGAVARATGSLPLGTRLVVREAVRGLGRSGVAVAALVVAVATAVGMGIMVESFRGSVERWLTARLEAPLYLRLPVGAEGADAVRAVLEERSVAGWIERRSFDDTLDGRPVRVSLFRAHGTVPEDRGLVPVEGGAVDPEAGAWLSEPLARALDLGAGDALPLLPGARSPPVAGRYREYGGGRGSLVLPLDAWPDPPPGMASFELFPEGDPEPLARALRAAAPAAELRRNEELLALSLSIFDRTFRVTGVLQTLAGVVAAVGLFGALSALALDRRARFGMLRTLGVGRAAPARQALAEAGLLALAAAVLALPLGVAVAWILVEFVNVRAFGWSLDFAFPPGLFAQAVLVALAAGLGAAAVPAWRLWRARPAELLADARALA
jgi:putative ABC transport system permease protein